MYLGNTLSFTFVLFCMIAWTKCGEGPKWGYHHDPVEQRPENWYKNYPKCGGKRQSPVHFYSNKLKYDPALTPVEFIGYDKPTQNITLFNNGHTVFIILETDRAHHIKGAGLPGEYILHSLHLHWGSGNENGSEHWLDSTHYAAEVHYVHYHTKYKTVDEALKSTDGNALAVIGTLIKIGAENPAFDAIINNTNGVAYKEEEIPIPNLNLNQMLPKKLATYFRYDGSLTTPKCEEVVVWTVYQDPITLSQRQIDAFRNQLHSIYRNESLNAKLEQKSRLLDNYRPPQPTNGRLVTTNDKVLGFTSGSLSLCGPCLSLLMILGKLVHYFL